MEWVSSVHILEAVMAMIVCMIGVGAVVGGIMNASAKKKFATKKDLEKAEGDFDDKCHERQEACTGKVCVKLDAVEKDIKDVKKDIGNIYESQEKFTFFMGRVSQFMNNNKKLVDQ